MFTSTALVVVESRINYFYEPIITFLNASLGSCESCEYIWNILDDFLSLTDLLRRHFDQISQKSLWADWNLMKNQVYLLENLIRETEYVKAKKKQIDNWFQNGQNGFGIFKVRPFFF